MLSVSDLFLIKKETLAYSCFGAGMLVAYWGSLNPWFFWPIGSLYIFPAGFLVLLSLCVSNALQHPLFTRAGFLWPLVAYVVLSFYLLLVNGGNVNAFIGNMFHVMLFWSLFIVNREILFWLTTFLSKAMACLLVVSMSAFVLYLLGFPLPSWDTQFGDGLYTYSNFFFFLFDDRSIMSIFPRFHSVFLEPGHLGTATVLLLFSQCGHWKTWYNVVLLVATLMTFSLAAYVLLVVIVFLNLWIKGKHVVGKVLATVALIAAVVVGAFYYNRGDNLLHDLILIRLEISDEGELSGDNRVAGWFESEYESYLQSSDIFFGRDYDTRITGNSGYRVFIYENGFVGLFLVIVFYLLSMMHTENRRVVISAFVIAILCFWVRGYPLWYSNFIPLYALVNMPFACIGLKKEEE